MTQVNILEAKTNLSRLIEAVESGAEDEIVIARNGKPAVKIVPLTPRRKPIRLGLADGMFEGPSREPDPEVEAEIARMFGLKP